MHLSTVLPSSIGCCLGIFALSTEQESINPHLFLSNLGFAVCHQTCISTFMLRQLVAGRGGFHGGSLCSDAVEMQQRWTARLQARAQNNSSSCQTREQSPCEAAGQGQKTQKCFSLFSLSLHCKIAGSPAQAEPKQVFKPFLCQNF